jgi:2-haloacid dehalogenase
MTKITTVVFDVGKVLFEWDLRHLFAKLIADKAELEYFVTHVVTPEWHFQHDAGRPLAEMTAHFDTEAHAVLFRLKAGI